jgi:uncharacterized protein YecE (DUF72 family)
MIQGDGWMNTCKVFAGMGGWDLFPFDNVFYPKSLPKGFRKLRHYSQYFDFVEINATFYNSSFSRQQVLRWLEDVSANENFIFTAKLFRGFTHLHSASKSDYLNSCTLFETLASKGNLGGVVIQFPYSFAYSKERYAYLAQLSKAFAEFNLFVELRHNSWNSQAVLNFLDETNLRFINVDLPKIKQHMPFQNQFGNGTAYYRMMGRNGETWDRPFRRDGNFMVSDRYSYSYSDKELDQLVSKLEEARTFTQRMYVVFHNDPNANSLKNGFKLRTLLEEKKLRIPENLLIAHPSLESAALPIPIPEQLFNRIHQLRVVV